MKQNVYDYLERPKLFDRNDFWRQVRRTINGEPIGEDQIQLIVKQVAKYLSLGDSDKLLDIGCGNGALTARFECLTKEILGIDISDYLIGVAHEYFSSPKLAFVEQSIEKTIEGDLNKNYNKALLYGVSSYLSDETLERLVTWYFTRSGNATMFIGNIRDKCYADDFYKERKTEKELSDPTTAIGKWRTQEWFIELAENSGLQASITKMPGEYYFSRFYFDLVLTRS